MMESNFYLICFKKVKLLWKKGFKQDQDNYYYVFLHSPKKSSENKNPRPTKKINTLQSSHYYFFPLLLIYFCVAGPFYSYLALLIPQDKHTQASNILEIFYYKALQTNFDSKKKKFSSVKGNYFKTTFIKKIDCS